MNKLFKLLFIASLVAIFSVNIAGCSTSPTTQRQALTQVIITPTYLVVWANEAAVASFTYSFANYEQALQSASGYYTPEGWTAFKNALNNSGNLNTVVKKKMIVSAVAEGSPIILSQGISAGEQMWIVQMPLLVTYQGAKTYNKQHAIVTMSIVKTPPGIGTRGLGIQLIVVKVVPRA